MDDALAELALYARPRALRWEAVRAERPRAATPREQTILAALAALRVLSGPQIGRRFMPEASRRSVRHQLRAMVAQSWLRRAHLACEGPGQTPRLFCLDDAGYEVIRDVGTRFRPFVVDRREWTRPEFDARLVPRQLHANAWYFVFERLAGRIITGVRAGEPTADLAIETSVGQHYLLQLERSWQPLTLAEKLVRYDGPTSVIFVFPDEPTAIAAARLADSVVTHSGRERMFFASEPDIHRGRLRALVLPKAPGLRPALRAIIEALSEVP